MNREQRRRIADVLIPLLSNNGGRANFIQNAWGDEKNITIQVDYSGPGNVFVGNLLMLATRYGTINGRAAVLYLLDEAEVLVGGGDTAAEIAALKAELGDPGAAPLPPPSTPPPASPGGQTFNVGNASAPGGIINIGGTIVYGNAPGVPNEPPPPTPATSGAAPNGSFARDQVFISYSHRETEWLDNLMVSLKPRMRRGAVSVWTDKNIAPGDRWRDQINTALAKARVAVLLVSRHFFASDFIAEKELPVILAAAKRRDLTLLWVPVTYSSVTETEVAEYQTAGAPLLSPSVTLDTLDDATLNRALDTVARQIVDAYNAYDV